MTPGFLGFYQSTILRYCKKALSYLRMTSKLPSNASLVRISEVCRRPSNPTLSGWHRKRNPSSMHHGVVLLLDVRLKDRVDGTWAGEGRTGRPLLALPSVNVIAVFR